MALDRTSVVKKADGFARAGKLDLAIAEYKALLDGNPGDASAANALGDLYARQGSVRQAVEQFIGLAEGEWRQGSGAKAIAFYKKALKVSPDCDEALMRLGEITASQSLVADAAKHWNRLADLRSSRHDVAGAEEVRGWLSKLRTRHAGLQTPVEPMAASTTAVAASQRATAPPVPPAVPPPVPIPAPAPTAAPPADLQQQVSPALRTFEPVAYPALDLPDDAPEQDVPDGGDAAVLGYQDEDADPGLAQIEAHHGIAAPAAGPEPDIAGDDWQAPRLSDVPASRRRFAEEDADVTDDPDLADLWAAPAARAAAAPELSNDALGAEQAAGPDVEAHAEAPAPAPSGDSEVWEDVSMDLDALDALDALDGSEAGESSQAISDAAAAPASPPQAGPVVADTPDAPSAASPDAPLDPRTVRELSAAAETPELRFQAAAQLGRLFVTHGQLGDGIAWLQRACDAEAPMRERRLEVHYELADALERAGQSQRALEVFADLELEAASYRDVTERINRLEHQAGAP